MNTKAVLFIVFQVNHFRGTVVDIQDGLTVLLLIPLISVSVQGFPLGNQVQQAFESEDFLFDGFFTDLILLLLLQLVS